MAVTESSAAGTPWRVAETLEVIAILDTPAWACLCGLLSECPVVPAALSAILDRRTRAVSATAFACFTTRSACTRTTSPRGCTICCFTERWRWPSPSRDQSVSRCLWFGSSLRVDATLNRSVLGSRTSSSRQM